MSRSAHLKGFTLLELIVVIAIIGVISVIILPSFKTALSKANDTKLKQYAVNLEKRYEVTTKYDFEEGSGLLAKDTSINVTSSKVQNNLVIPGSGMSYSSNTYSSSSQYSIYMDGSTFATTQNNTDPSLDAKSFSISFWFKRTGGFGAGDRMFLGKGINGGCAGFYLGMRNDAMLIGFWGMPPNTSNTITDTDWHFVTYSFDASTTIGVLYLDSVKVSQTTYGCVLSNTNAYPLRTSYTTPFVGNIDDVRFYENQIMVR